MKRRNRSAGGFPILRGQLAAHRLGLLLSDEPAASSTNFKTFTHAPGESGTAFCGEKKLALCLKRGLPKSLHDAPALLPPENTILGRALEPLFREQAVEPRAVAQCEDLALMLEAAARRGRR